MSEYKKRVGTLAIAQRGSTAGVLWDASREMVVKLGEMCKSILKQK